MDPALICIKYSLSVIIYSSWYSIATCIISMWVDSGGDGGLGGKGREGSSYPVCISGAFLRIELESINRGERLSTRQSNPIESDAKVRRATQKLVTPLHERRC